MFVHVKRTQATLGLSVVFATVAMVRTDRALPCNLFDRRRVLQYAAQVLQYAAFSAAVRARTLGSALQHAALVLRYAASSAAVCRDHTPQYASGPSARRCSALHQVPQCVPQCAASGAAVRCDR